MEITEFDVEDIITESVGETVANDIVNGNGGGGGTTNEDENAFWGGST